MNNLATSHISFESKKKLIDKLWNLRKLTQRSLDFLVTSFAFIGNCQMVDEYGARVGACPEGWTMGVAWKW